MTQLNTTELDFDQIKNNLINYFKRSDGPFKDWDFTGSGLNQLVDILAYNTHYNAVTAHMALNESFLDSAQIRKNIVSRAKALGYTPKSMTAPEARLNVVLQRTSGSASSYTLSKGTTFSATVGDINYPFQTTKTKTVSLNAGPNTFTFDDLPVMQGISRSQRFTTDNSVSNQKFVLEDQNIDTSTMVVKVYDSLTSSLYQTYQLYSSILNVSSTSLIYFLNEGNTGSFEISFGNGVFGKQPTAASLIVVEYETTQGPDANGANSFTLTQTGLSNVSTLSVTTLSSASGGALKETSESIKFNAPLSFQSQDRAVTTSDFRSIIKSTIAGITDVLAWGGEIEANPQYGKVYISVKPEGADFLSSDQKTSILNVLNQKKVVGMSPEIVDPTYTYLYFDVKYRFDPILSNFSESELTRKIRNVIGEYSTKNLNNFNANFRYSKLLTAIDQIDDSILASHADVYVYKNINLVAVDPTRTDSNTQDVEFGLKLGGSLSQDAPLVSSSVFQVDGIDCTFSDVEIVGDTEKRKLIVIRGEAGDTNVTQVDNVGYVYIDTGKIQIDDIRPSVASTVSIYTNPANLNVNTNKRNILQINAGLCIISGTTDAIDANELSGSDTTTTLGTGVNVNPVSSVIY